MNSSALRHVFRLGVAVLFGLLPACASASEADPLKVQVNVPPTWNLLIDDQVSEALVDQMRDVFYRAGFARRIDEVRSFEIPSKVPYLLTINLTEWRINRLGNIDCTFTANLKTPRGTRELGVYTNTTMEWLYGRSRFGLGRGFVEAAEGALRDLYTDLAKTELLPAPGKRSNA